MLKVEQIFKELMSDQAKEIETIKDFQECGVEPNLPYQVMELETAMETNTYFCKCGESHSEEELKIVNDFSAIWEECGFPTGHMQCKSCKEELYYQNYGGFCEEPYCENCDQFYNSFGQELRSPSDYNNNYFGDEGYDY